jgi:hypothetical protein
VILAGLYLGCHVPHTQSYVEAEVEHSRRGLDRCLLSMKGGVSCS